MSLGLLWVSLLAGKESLDCEPWGWDPAGYWYIAGTLDIQWMTFKENSKLSKHSLGGSVTGNLPSGFENLPIRAYLIVLCFTDVENFCKLKARPAKELWLPLLPCGLESNPLYLWDIPVSGKSASNWSSKSEHLTGSNVLLIPSPILIFQRASFNFHLLPTTYPPVWKQCLLKKWSFIFLHRI